MKQGLSMFSVHAAITFTTDDGWQGSRTGDIPTFAVVGATVADAQVNAAALFGMPVGTTYTLPGEVARTITGATFTAYPMDDAAPPQPGPSYLFRMSMDGGDTWTTHATGLSEDDVSAHMDRIDEEQAGRGVEVAWEFYTSGTRHGWQVGVPTGRTVRWEWTPQHD